MFVPLFSRRSDPPRHLKCKLFSSDLATLLVRESWGEDHLCILEVDGFTARMVFKTLVSCCYSGRR